MSRDEIIEEIRKCAFRVRAKFIRELTRECQLPSGNQMAWPDAVLHLTVEQWNAAYYRTMKWRLAAAYEQYAKLKAEARSVT